MPTTRDDQALAPVLAAWASRMVLAGINYDDFVQTIASVAAWSDWPAAWTALGERFEGFCDVGVG